MQHSIVKRVRLVILSTAVVVVGTIGPVVMLSEYFLLRDTSVANIESLAQVIAFNLRAPIAFDNAHEAERTLKGMSTVPSIEAAVVLTKDIAQLAMYTSGSGSVVPMLASLFEEGEKAGRGTSAIKTVQTDRLTLAVPVVLGGETIGVLALSANLDQIYSQILGQVSLLAILLLAGVLIAYLVGIRMQHAFTRPIQALVKAMQDVSKNKNYNARIEKHDDDEVGELVNNFNLMLGEIEERDQMLEDANEHLETQVRERTKELSHSNAVLSKTLAEVERAKDAAEAASRAKSAFLATMSHEIRTPINGMLGNTELLLNEKLPVKARAYGEVAYRCGEALLDIINDILDFSRIEAGKLELAREDFDLASLIRELCSSLAPTIEAKKLHLVVDEPLDMNTLVGGDPGRIRQVVANLITNAVKFTRKGSITVACSILTQTAESTVVKVTVQDTGIGIDDEKQTKIFERFAQADSTTERQYGGTGLGLAICNELVRKMNGEIGVESTVGAGSTFWFTAELATTDKPIDQTEAAIHVDDFSFEGNCAVLVVDDNEINRDMAARMLEQLTCDVTTVDSGEAAVEAARSHNFDLILMDCQMPGMDGFRATGKIRAIERSRIAHPAHIVALTANAIKGDRDRCIEAGMDDYIAKPFKQRDLAAAIHRAVKHSQALETESSRTDDVLDHDALTTIKQLDQGSKQELLKRYINIFLDSAPKLITSIENALNDMQHDDLTFAAHSLKSESLSLGASRLGELARTFEERGRNNQLDGLDSALPELAQEFEKVNRALQLELRASA